MGTVQNSIYAIPVKNRTPPPEGSKTIPLTVVLTPSNPDVFTAIDLSSALVSQICTAIIDNTQNPVGLNINMGVIENNIAVAPYTGLILPAFSNGPNFPLTVQPDSVLAGEIIVQITLLNFERAPAEWTNQAIAVSGNVGITGTPTISGSVNILGIPTVQGALAGNSIGVSSITHPYTVSPLLAANFAWSNPPGTDIVLLGGTPGVIIALTDLELAFTGAEITVGGTFSFNGLIWSSTTNIPVSSIFSVVYGPGGGLVPPQYMSQLAISKRSFTTPLLVPIGEGISFHTVSAVDISTAIIQCNLSGFFI
jgi:hypothetical protein